MSTPLLLTGVTISIGNRYSDASSQPTGISDPTPFMSWTLPAGVTQQRFQIIINNVDPTPALGYAVMQSGIQISTAQQYNVTELLALNATFNGVCMVTVQLSSNNDPTAAMESVSAPTYFVFDPSIDSLYRTPDVQISWAQVVDPDGGPSSLTYQYQISQDPQFVSNNVLLGSVAAPTSGRGSVNVPTGVFVPALDEWYFFRVRGYDGLDYGEWSQVNAFISRSTVSSSTFTIDDVRIVGDAVTARSIDIAFTITDTSDQFYCVQFTYQGIDQRYPSIPIANQPLCLRDPVHRVQAGSHVVRWTTAEQLGSNKVSVIITGTAFPATSNSVSVQYGPVLVDNTEASVSSGGSPTSFTFPAYLGWVDVDVTTEVSFLNATPAVTVFGPDPTPAVAEVNPVSRGDYLWRNTYVVGRIEQVKDAQSAQGYSGFTAIPQSAQSWWYFNIQDQQWEVKTYGYNNSPSDLRSWPGPIASDNLPGGNSWLAMSVASGRQLDNWDCKTTPISTHTGFMFYAPRDDTLPTTIPTPHRSTDGNKMAHFLTGYYDLSGVAQTYPNGYDWNNRPEWHNGREIYGENDAWVQVVSVHWTHYDICQTCKGLFYIVEGTAAPYQRVRCPNPTCFNGFDYQLPIYTLESNVDSLGQPIKNPIVKNYMEVSWERFSKWYTVDWTWNDRRGLTMAAQPFATKRAHIYGRGLDSVERVYSTVANQDGTFPLIGHNITINGYTSLMPETPFSFERWDFTQYPNIVGPVSRQENELPKPTLYIEVDGFNQTQGSVSYFYPVVDGMATATKYLDTDPAVTTFGPDPVQFWMGGADPVTDPLAYRRPPTTEPGDLCATVSFQTVNITVTNTFRFLNVTPMWDAFTTIHWQHNESDTTYCQVQYRLTTDVNEADWLDIRGLNATYNTQLGRWLTPPHCNYIYWDTEDPVVYPEGSTYYLRLRTTDPSSSIDSPWVYSTMVTVSHGITNPVNVMSTSYEPWSKEVTITIRCDDTQSDAYTLTEYWYTVDPLADNPTVTWNQISAGDISGETVGLSSTPGENEHVIIWNTEPYGLEGSPRYRLMIQCIPTGLLANVTVPFLKFLTPMNPYIDAAQADYNSIMGVIVTQVYNSTDNAYVPANPSYYQTGDLLLAQKEMIQVKSDPPAGSGDSPGWYAFYTPTPPGSVWADLQIPGYNSSSPGNSPLNTGYTLTDPAGLASWMSSKYDATENHGQAMQRVAATINNYVTLSIPQDTAAMASGEISIRKDLITQGYYAEDHFISGGANGGVKEWIEVAPVSNLTGNALSTQTGRQWRFRVQNVAADGDDVFNDGVYDPAEITPLEQVFYKVELDYTQTYDSQPFARPLRRFITDPQGNRLSIAEPYTGVGFNGEANAGAAPTSTQSGVTTSSPPINVAGVLKIVPMLLPGQVTQAVLTSLAAANSSLPQVMPNQAPDQFAPGQTAWTGTYYWRVRAYNYVIAPIAAIPRPLITATAAGPSTLNVTYTSQAHEDIQQSSLNYDPYYGTVFGYRISDSFLPATTWLGVASVDDATPRTEIDWVSDVRANANDPSRKLNFIPWVPIGTDRPHPCVFYDPTQQQYVWFMTKDNFNGQPRIMGGRSMSFPKACEFTVYFGDAAYTSIWGPCCFPDPTAGGYRMYACVDPGGGYPTQLCMTTSPDADAWAGLEVIETQGMAIGFDVKNACVLYDANASPTPLYRMWYERTQNGMRQIFYATSTDGVTFAAANNDNPVYFDMVNVMSPSVVYLNSSWVMYYHDGDGCIASVVSTDGITWTGKHYEMAPATITLDGASLAVTYANPCVFFDRFYGNQELLMAYNVVKPTGENITHVSRLESRVWRLGVAGGISGATLDVPFSRDGSTNANSIVINSSANSVVPNANVKVRLWFDTITPETTEFHRESDWVDINNDTDVGGYMDPVPYKYDDTLLQYPYMTLYATTNVSSGSSSNSSSGSS